MIGLDNGPANGDYVRYIERLIAETKTASLLPAALSAPVFGSPTVAPAQIAARLAARVAPPAAARIVTPAPPVTNNMLPASDVVARPVQRNVAEAATPDSVQIRAVGTIALGLVLLAIGFLSAPIKFILLSIGFIVLASGVRALLRSTAAARSASKVS